MLQTHTGTGLVHSPEGMDLQEPLRLAVKLGERWTTLTYIEKTDRRIWMRYVLRTTGRPARLGRAEF
jgi:hypothetical protein